MNLEYRTAQLLEAPTQPDTAAGGIKTIRALAVPYSEDFNEVAQGMFERFTAGALTPGADPMKLRLEHETTIGKITASSETENGLEIEATISDTAAGRDAAALLDDGVLTAVSIGFNPDYESADIVSRDDGALYITHKHAELMEVSLVSFPAYKGATINEIRSETNQGKDDLTMDKDMLELRAQLEDVAREVHAMSESTRNVPVSPLEAYRSAGDFMKAYAAGVDNVRTFADDANVWENADQRTGWLEREIKLMEAKQPVTSMFTHAYNLPPQGMSFDYPVIGTSSLAVKQQTTEGEALAHGKLTLSHGNVEVKTFGGYTALSRQVIDRANPIYLSTIHTAMGIEYANAIEARTQAVLKATLESQLQASEIESSLQTSALTVDEIIAIGLDIIDYFDDNVVYPFTGLAVSADVFQYFALLAENAKAFQFAGAPTDKIGTLSILSRSGELDGLTITRLPAGVGAGHMFGYSKAAIEVIESPNAPLRLSDQRDDTTLSNIYSVYGYATHAAIAPSAIVPVKFAGTAA
ncbi:MAG: HK97 family phage prohead protease [Actinomycetaceae bacterium]|nr:HK97 family phage prohead protease [Actinomycetaceae bacterium]MDY5854936.1 HK97 family phage prohead protease [Arcanobacterium sp.]